MPKDWSGKTGGTRRMQQGLIVLLRVVHLPVIYGIMGVVILFYMLFRHSTYIAIYHYFRHIHGDNVWRAFLHTYINYFHFGQVILDRFAAWAGQEFRFTFDNEEQCMQVFRQQDGAIVLFSHVGNFEIAGYYFQTHQKRMNIVAYGGDTATVMQNRVKQLGLNNIAIIAHSDDMSHIFKIHTALANGEIVSMAGDRGLGSLKTVFCRVLGHTAELPQGPFRIAAAAGKEIIVLFVMKEHNYEYRIYHFPLHVDARLKRTEQVQDLAQQYADCLTTIAQKYPTQWFHFYEFWRH